jgi:hypothetical protein
VTVLRSPSLLILKRQTTCDVMTINMEVREVPYGTIENWNNRELLTKLIERDPYFFLRA